MLSDTIHLWKNRAEAYIAGRNETKCGRLVVQPTNVLFASTAERLKIPPSNVCKTCYRLGPPWLVLVK